MKRTLQLSSLVDLKNLIGDQELVAFDVGPDGLVYMVADGATDHRFYKTSGAGFAKTRPDRPQSYRVLALDLDQIVLDVRITGEKFNIHHIQPLGADELLLVCARSYYRRSEDFDKNGRVYDRSGRFLREILLGDGIQSVQTDSNGKIWTSYFDEGIFGNYGWEQPIGASGLIAWDARGNQLYEFEPNGDLDSMCDCYALNVASADDVWCHYYTEFPLVHLRNGVILTAWNVPVSGSHAIAIQGQLALIRGGYKECDEYSLVGLLPDGKSEILGKIEFIDSGNRRLKAEQAVARADALYLLRGSEIYRMDVATAAQVVGL